ncbi:MAG: hypothetical protein D6814_13920 [Calditrichaeota bacterium]|nr:MAG: hypothetical protein D6814_13920 [Calditrichota bacterium]
MAISQSFKIPLSYPFCWQGIEDFRYPRDQHGIPRVYISPKWGLRYNPITIAQYGLHHLTQYAATGNTGDLQVAQRQAEWLAEHIQPWHRDIWAWVYDYDLDFYGKKAPWISAMAQGEAISLLIRIHQIQPHAKIPDICQHAVQAFYYSVDDGGVMTTFPDGTPIFEEYTTHPPSQVLNGHIFSLLGLHDFALFFEDARALTHFNRAIDGLIANLWRYDTGYWNLYDLHPTHRLASPDYVRIHIQLLNILHTITQLNEFKQVANKWQTYLQNPSCRLRWFTVKCLEKARLKLSGRA